MTRLRTSKQYMESLRDDREVYFEGERVPDVTAHPSLRRCINSCASLYDLYHNPHYRSLVVSKSKEGESVPFMYLPVRNAEDLLRRREVYLLISRIALGFAGGFGFAGLEALNASTIVSRRMDRELGTSYAERVDNYRKYLLGDSLAICGAVTDVKGDRSLRPGQQADKDLYVRIVDERKDGIVVRGAKMHISRAPVSNEIFVCPTRAMREEDKDYAVAFAIPTNTRGLIMVVGSNEPEEGYLDDFPITSRYSAAEALVIFEDVFVPMERVFLKKEWQFSGEIARMFSNFQRLWADSCKYTELELVVGAAALMAEYNGIEKVPHVRDELSWLVSYVEAVGVLGRAGCMDCVVEPETGLAYPNVLLSNAGKLLYGEYFHQAVKCVQDIAGGIVADVPSFKNFQSPETHRFVEKYFKGKAGIPTEYRLRAILLARDICNDFHLAQTIHADGSLAAERIAIAGAADWERYKAVAKRVAMISDGSEHPITRDLPPYPPKLPI